MNITDYTLSDLKLYMEDKLNNSSTEGLFEFNFQSECREKIESLGYRLRSGEGLLFTFAAIAGGWQTDVGRRLLDNGENAVGISDDFERILSEDLQLVDEVGSGGHPHRHANGAHPTKALDSLARLEVNGTSVNSMAELFEVLSETEPDEGTQFDLAFNMFKSVKTFGALTSFDYLDVAVRVNEQEWLAPDQLKVRHVNRNGPGKTLRRVVDNSGGNADNLSESEEAEAVLGELQDFAETDLGLCHTDAFFDVESCLCTYHGELEGKGPDWRGGCT